MIKAINFRAILFVCAFTCLPLMMVNMAHAKEGKVLDIQELTTPSGIKIWFVQDKSVPIVAMDFHFHPPHQLYTLETQGITDYFASMLDEGAGDMDSQSFQRALEDYNISMSFDGGRDAFVGEAYMLKKYFDKGVELLTLAVNEPRFDEEPMERMRRAHLTSARRALGSPSTIRALLSNEYSYEVDHYYAWNSGGTISSIEAMDVAALQEFRKRVLTRDYFSIAIAGDITQEQAIKAVEKIFGALPNAAEAPLQDVKTPGFPYAGKAVWYEKDSLPQTYLRFIWDGIDSHDPDYPAYVVMNYILGGGGFSSRLMQDIREERGLTYGISSGNMSNDLADRFRISTSTKHGNLDEMRERILYHVQKITSEDISQDDLSKAQSFLTGSMVLGLSSTSQIASVTSSLLYNQRPIDHLDGYKDRINSVTIEDVRRVAKRMFEGKEPLEVYVGQLPSTIEDSTVIKVDTVRYAE
jgi:zinc protease